MQLRGFTLVDLLIAMIVAGLMAAVALPTYKTVVQRAQIGSTIGEMGQIQLAVTRFQTNNGGRLPDGLVDIGMQARTDPWGNPYQYLNIEAGANPGAARKDRNLVPINTDYDLYSLGRDGQSAPALTARQSRDDVIRANNGNYFGPAEDY